MNAQFPPTAVLPFNPVDASNVLMPIVGCGSSATVLPVPEPFCDVMKLIRIALADGKAYLNSAGGGMPANPGRWGWTRTSSKRPWQPQGVLIGWLDEDVYLDPKKTFHVITQLADSRSLYCPATRKAFAKLMKKHGLLFRDEYEKRGVLTVRKTIGDVNARLDLWQLLANRF